MKYLEHKKLIQEEVMPHLSGKLFISEQAICMSQTDTIKLVNSLKNILHHDNYFLYNELRKYYVHQVCANYEIKNYDFNFSLMPYAKKHGLVKQLRKMIKE